jgi:hypothetical protein
MFLKNSICAFLDILGFSEAIERAYKAGTQFELLEEIATALNAAKERLKDWQSGSDPILDVRFFTDCLVIRRTNFTNDGIMELMDVCFAVNDFQLTMARKGFFVRGGISIGTMEVNDTIVFGDALVKAHQLENTKARTPRVILDPNLKLTLDQYISTKPFHSNQWNGLLMSDVDGHYFVNYLLAIYEPDIFALGGRVMRPNEEKLAEHRQQIEKHLRETVADPHIWSKYFWSANYHDSFCMSINMKQHKIDASLIRPGPKNLVNNFVDSSGQG